VDERGRKSERSFALPVPDYPRLVVFAERQGFAPRDVIPLYLVALDAKGHPASAISLVTRPNVGLAPAALAPGLFRAELALPAASRPLRLSFGLAGSGPSQRVLLFRPEDRKPARILLSAEPRELNADGRSECCISVALENQAREPLAGLAPALRCTSGSLGPPVALGLGRFRARLTAPESGQGEITCEAKAGEARENLWIALEQKRPASLEASAAPRYLHRDGRSVARIDVRLRDQRGQPLSGEVIRTEECPGALGPFLDLGDGRYSATYTAPLQGDPAEQRIFLELSAGEGAVRQRLPLWLLPEGAPLPAEPGADDRWEMTPAGRP